MFTFDFYLLVKRLLPPFLRKQIMVAWATVLLAPTENVWAQLVAYYAQIIAYTSLVPETYALQYELRLRYPNVGGQNGYKVYIHTKYDDYPTTYSSFIGEHHLQEEFDFFINETQPATYEWYSTEYVFHNEYFVTVPTAYNANAVDIENFLNTYRPAGRRFILQFQDII
jgi:hypothetical protein